MTPHNILTSKRMFYMTFVLYQCNPLTMPVPISDASHPSPHCTESIARTFLPANMNGTGGTV